MNHKTDAGQIAGRVGTRSRAACYNGPDKARDALSVHGLRGRLGGSDGHSVALN